MKYRFRVSKAFPVDKNRQEQALVAKRPNKLQRKAALPEPIETIDFYEFDEAAQKQKSRKSLLPYFLKIGAFFRAIARGVRYAFKSAALAIGRLSSRIKANQQKKRISSLPVISGALCAALVVSSISAGTVLLGLFYRYSRSYVSLTVPNFIGSTPTDVLGSDESRFNLIIQYEYNENVEKGRVISQTPRAGVTRRIYGSDEYCDITLTVSRGEEIYTVSELSGMTLRDAKLKLNNSGVSADIKEVYSDTVPKGTVIDTTPSAGAELALGQSIVLRVSAGKRVVSTTVPDIFGYTESSAASLLSAAGLILGSVSYEASSYPVGTVIAQDAAAGTSVKKGTAISITVSAGSIYSPRQIPDLYGMTVDEANQKLREYGIVVGEVFSVNEADPSGTVVAQSPSAGAPITSSTVSVDIYISS